MYAALLVITLVIAHFAETTPTPEKERLGDTKGPPVSLEAWTKMLGEKSSSRLVKVLNDGLSDDSEESAAA